MRWLLGLTAVGFLVTAAVAWTGEETGMAGILARVGIVLAALWIGYPAVTRVDVRTLWLGGLALVVVLLRPRSAIVVLPVVAWFARTTKPRR